MGINKALSNQSNRGATISAIMFFVLTLCFFGPGHIYFNNIFEFGPSFTRLLPYLIAVSVLLLAILLPLGFLRGRFAGYLTTAIFSLALLLWVQGTLLDWDYGLITGEDVNWKEKSIYGIIDMAVWGLVTVLAVARPNLMLRASGPLSRGLIIIQAISLIVLAVSAPNVHFKDYEEDETYKYTLGREQNVIILVIDSFQPDSFMSALRKYPDIATMLDGFTFYPDATAGYPRTHLAVPLILTGRFYENQMPFMRFIKESYLGESIPRMLKERGFHVYLPLKPYIFTSDAISSSLRKRVGISISDWNEAVELILISMFRQSPHYLKKELYPILIDYRLNGWPTGDGLRSKHVDMVFLDRFTSGASTMSGPLEKTFKFYHLHGLHLPLDLNEKLRQESITVDRKGLARAVLGQMRLISIFLKTIEDAGVYDETMVLVLGDHGSDFPSSPSAFSDGTMGYVNPLVLVKPFGSRGRLEISRLPVSLQDVPATVFDALGIESEMSPGLSMLKEDAEHVSRIRRYLSMDWTHDKVRKYYDKPLLEYEINGNAIDIASWSRSGRIFPEGMKTEGLWPSSFARGYYFGERVRFGSEGNGSRYLTGDWATRWMPPMSIPMAGCRGAMEFSVLPTDDGLSIDILFEPSTETHPTPEVNVNGFMAKGTSKTRDLYRFEIDKPGIASSGKVALELNVCDSASTLLTPLYLRELSINKML